MAKKINSLLDKITEIISIFIGSWTGVLFHIIWFFLWLVYGLDINLLTLIVSLEAIFICVFLLMAANKEESQRHLTLAKESKQNQQRMDFIIKLDQKADRQLTEIKRLQKELHLQIHRLPQQLNGKKKY